MSDSAGRREFLKYAAALTVGTGVLSTPGDAQEQGQKKKKGSRKRQERPAAAPVQGQSQGARSIKAWQSNMRQ